MGETVAVEGAREEGGVEVRVWEEAEGAEVLAGVVGRGGGEVEAEVEVGVVEAGAVEAGVNAPFCHFEKM